MTKSFRNATFAGMLFAAGMGAVFLAGCGSEKSDTAKSAPVSTGGPMISATPNPVPVDSTTTTITWDTGDDTLGEVYVVPNGAPEKRFAGDLRKGSQDASWIKRGEYEFRLYAGKERKTLLASVKVTKAKND